MLCPDGEQYHTNVNEDAKEDEVTCPKKNTNVPNEGPSNFDLSSFKHPKTWKKSITNFFRNQLRSTRSNDGDQSGNTEKFTDKELAPEQKWQSLGKVFRRQSYADRGNPNQGETSHNKRNAVRKVFSSYFGKKSDLNDD